MRTTKWIDKAHLFHNNFVYFICYICKYKSGDTRMNRNKNRSKSMVTLNRHKDKQILQYCDQNMQCASLLK